MAAITYQEIFKKSQVANSLIGMTQEEFEKLYAEFELAHVKRWSISRYTQRHQGPRKRGAGAGRKYKYALRDRLLMSLFWLRAYTTYEVLGTFYHLNKTTVEDNIKDVLDTLATMKTFRFELPQPEVPKLRSVQDVMDAFPDLWLILDDKEQQ